MLKYFRQCSTVLSGFHTHIQLAACSSEQGCGCVPSGFQKWLLCLAWLYAGSLKASFLTASWHQAHVCSGAASVQKHPNIRTNWNKPGVVEELEPSPVRSARPRVSTQSPRVTSLWHRITESNMLHSLTCVIDGPNPNTHTHRAWLDHLICTILPLLSLSLSLSLPPPLMSSLAPLLMARWKDGGSQGGAGLGGDWNLRGMVSSLLTGSICKTFPTLLPDTDDSPEHHHDR